MTCHHGKPDGCAACDEIAALRAKVAELERESGHAVYVVAGLLADAERYRWLRDQKIYYGDGDDGMTWAGMDWCVEVASIAPPSLDAAIDAMREPGK
jgi:hypothetical protein